MYKWEDVDHISRHIYWHTVLVECVKNRVPCIYCSQINLWLMPNECKLYHRCNTSTQDIVFLEVKLLPAATRWKSLCDNFLLDTNGRTAKGYKMPGMTKHSSAAGKKRSFTSGATSGQHAAAWEKTFQGLRGWSVHSVFVCLHAVQIWNPLSQVIRLVQHMHTYMYTVSQQPASRPQWSPPSSQPASQPFKRKLQRASSQSSAST